MRDPSVTECPSENIEYSGRIFAKGDLTLHPIARAVIGKPGEIDLPDAPDTN